MKRLRLLVVLTLAALTSSALLVGCSQSESDFDGQIHFAGSSSLAPIVAATGAQFQSEFTTWHNADASLPDVPIDIAVTSGGSGDGP